MIKKLKSRAGLTLTELLVTVLLLTLFSSASLIGITTALRARQDHIKMNDADILASLVQNIITDELRLSEYAENYENSSAGISGLRYKSNSSDPYEYATIYLDSDGRLYMLVGNDDSKAENKQPLLNEASYSIARSAKTLKIDALNFEIKDDGIEVSFSIMDVNNEGLELAKKEFFVNPLNEIVARP